MLSEQLYNEAQQHHFYYLTPDGLELPLNSLGSKLVSYNNVGAAGLQNFTEQDASQNGETWLDYRWDSRLLQFSIARQPCGCFGICGSLLEAPILCNNEFITCNEDTITCVTDVPIAPIGCDPCIGWWQSAAYLSNLLRPNRGGSGVLCIDLCDGTSRAIDVRVDRMPEISSLPQTATIPVEYLADFDLFALSPFWRDKDEQVIEFSFIGPLSSEKDMPNFFKIVEFVTCSTRKVYPTIELIGPINGPRIDIYPLDQYIELDYDIADGEMVTITLSPSADNRNRKTVVSSLVGDIVGRVVSGSFLSTFHITPRPQAIGGVNRLQFTGTIGSENAKARIKWFDLFLGVPL